MAPIGTLCAPQHCQVWKQSSRATPFETLREKFGTQFLSLRHHAKPRTNTRVFALLRADFPLCLGFLERSSGSRGDIRKAAAWRGFVRRCILILSCPRKKVGPPAKPYLLDPTTLSSSRVGRRAGAELARTRV
jgi:hypothetical protein